MRQRRRSCNGCRPSGRADPRYNSRSRYYFEPCADENPACDIYGALKIGRFTLLAEFAKTLDEWPGTFNPAIPQFAAHKVTSWGVGAKYAATILERDYDLSIEFSRFEAGPDGAPWERQNQIVAGIATHLTPSVKLFGEYIRTEGYAPLNFISGSDPFDPFPPGTTHSERDASSDILLMGVNVAF